ncbi:lrr and pyd domains-containing protein partial [Nannochloropsis oceanica]
MTLTGEDDWRKGTSNHPLPTYGLPLGLDALTSGIGGSDSSSSTVTTTSYGSSGCGSVWGTPTTSLSGSPPTSYFIPPHTPTSLNSACSFLTSFPSTTVTIPSNLWRSKTPILQRYAVDSTSTPTSNMGDRLHPIHPIGRTYPPKPNINHPPFPPAIATVILPALVPRLTLLLPLVELNIFLQVSKQHLASMAQSGALKALAVRHPRDNNSSNNNNNNTINSNISYNREGGGGGKQRGKERGGKEGTLTTGGKNDGSRMTGTTYTPTSSCNSYDSSCSRPHPLSSILSRFQTGLQLLRVADLRVLPATLDALNQGLLPRLSHLSLTNLNLPDDELGRLSSLLGTRWYNTNSTDPSPPPAFLLPHLECLDLSGNRFGDVGLISLASQLLGMGGLPRLTTLNLGANGLTHSGHALLALAAAFEARGREGRKEGGMGGQGQGQCVGLKKLVLGAWVWDRTSPFAVCTNSHEPQQPQQPQQPQGPYFPPLTSIHDHPLHRLLLCLAPSLEELDLTHASLLPSELQALAEAWRRVPPPSPQLSLFSSPLFSPRVPLRVLRLSLAHRPAQKGNSSGNNLNVHNHDKEEDEEEKRREGGLNSLIFSLLVRAICTANPPLFPHSLPFSGKGLSLEALLLEDNPQLGHTGLQVLSQCLQEGGLASLRTLNLNGSKCADSGLRELSRVLDGGAPADSSLQHIYLDDCSITGEGVAWLGGALVRGRLCNLVSLSLARNHGVGEEGVRYLVKFLEEMGGRCRLNMIDLRWTNMGVGGADALSQVLEGGSCPALSLAMLAQGGAQGTSWSFETRKSLHRVRGGSLVKGPGGEGAGDGPRGGGKCGRKEGRERRRGGVVEGGEDESETAAADAAACRAATSSVYLRR